MYVIPETLPYIAFEILRNTSCLGGRVAQQDDLSLEAHLVTDDWAGAFTHAIPVCCEDVMLVLCHIACHCRKYSGSDADIFCKWMPNLSILYTCYLMFVDFIVTKVFVNCLAKFKLTIFFPRREDVAVRPRQS